MLQVQDLEGELDSVKNQLHQMAHTLSDREAQLNMQTNNVAVRSHCVVQAFLGILLVLEKYIPWTFTITN